MRAGALLGGGGCASLLQLTRGRYEEVGEVTAALDANANPNAGVSQPRKPFSIDLAFGAIFEIYCCCISVFFISLFHLHAAASNHPKPLFPRISNRHPVFFSFTMTFPTPASPPPSLAPSSGWRRPHPAVLRSSQRRNRVGSSCAPPPLRHHNHHNHHMLCLDDVLYSKPVSVDNTFLNVFNNFLVL